jgi:hypothetical protein
VSAPWVERVNRAYAAAMRRPLPKRPRYWPELDALTLWQRVLVRRAVAERNTWEASCIARGWTP